MSPKKTNYQDLKQELDDIINKLQDEGMDIDEAVILHAKGQKVVAELEKYLKKTKHSFEQIKTAK